MTKFIFFIIKGKRRGRPINLDTHYSQTQPIRQTIKSTIRKDVSRKLNFGKPENPTNHIMSEDYKPEDR